MDREQPNALRTRAVRALGFSALFALVGLLVFWYLPAYHKSDIWWLDGMAQHYPALYYYNVVVRGFLHHPLAGISTWSWNLGLGADLPGTLQYYLYDPFALLSLVFPMHSLELAYLLLYFARLFAAGVAAYLYLRDLEARPLAATAGSLIYVFTGFALKCAFRSPDFATPMVALPLMLLGVERVLRGRRPYLLVFAVFFAAASNFYYFYQLTLIVVVYAVVRYFELAPPDARWKQLPPAAAKTAGLYLLGIALAAVSLIPVAMVFLGSSRAGGHPTHSLFSSMSGYRAYLLGLVSMSGTPNSAYEGYAVLGFLMLPALFMRRGRNLTTKVMVTIFVPLLVFPFFGSLFNGLSFPSYRFIFAWAIFLGAAAALVLSDPRPFSRRELIATLAALLAYGGIAMLVGSHFERLAVMPALAVGFATWGVLAIEAWLAERSSRARNGKASDTGDGAASVAAQWPRYVIVALLVVNLAVNGAVLYSRSGANMLKTYMPFGTVQHMFDRNNGRLAKELPQDGFYRVDKQRSVMRSDLRSAASNDALVQGYRGISFYFSMMNGGVFDYLHALDDRSMRLSFDYNGFDDRAALLALNSVRYYISPQSGAQHVPYGFTPFRQSGTTTIYENTNALPLGYVYHTQVPRAEFDAMTPLQRQQALLQSAVLDTGTPVSLPSTSSQLPVVDVPYTVTAGKWVQLDPANSRFRLLKPRQKVTLHFQAVPDAELYVDLLDLGYSKESPKARRMPLPAPNATPAERAAYDQANSAIRQPAISAIAYGTTGLPKTERTESPAYPYYWGDTSQLVNLGYQPKGITSVYLRPGFRGVYSYSRLKVYAVPMSGFTDSIARLRGESLNNVRVQGNSVSADFSAKGPGLLFLSIPYSTGWKATIDGRPATVVRANLGFIGIPVAGGSHTLALHYTTPGLVPGAIMSAIALALLLLLAGVAWYRRRGTAA